MCSVSAIAKLDSVSSDKLLREQDPFGIEQPAFDLRDVTLITPAALVQLAASCYALSKRLRCAVIRAENESVRGYLGRCGFFGVVTEVAEVEPALDEFVSLDLDALRGSNPMLIELTHIANGAALPTLLDQIVWVLRHRLRYRRHDAFDVATAVSEVCQNTFDHNPDTAGFIAMRYGHGARGFLEIGVSDYGDGLAATLKRNPKHGAVTSDLDEGEPAEAERDCREGNSASRSPHSGAQ